MWYGDCECECVRVCACVCQRDGGEGCYSDLMNPSAFRGHSSSCRQAGANKQRPGSASRGGAAVGRVGGGGLKLGISITHHVRVRINFILLVHCKSYFPKGGQG